VGRPVSIQTTVPPSHRAARGLAFYSTARREIRLELLLIVAVLFLLPFLDNFDRCGDVYFSPVSRRVWLPEMHAAPSVWLCPHMCQPFNPRQKFADFACIGPKCYLAGEPVQSSDGKPDSWVGYFLVCACACYRPASNAVIRGDTHALPCFCDERHAF
jgi:hypothetical protein